MRSVNMARVKYLFIIIMLSIPLVALAVDEDLSFGVDHVYYEDEYRIFDINFSTGTEEAFGDVNLSDSWSTKAAGHNPGLRFHPQNGDNKFFQIDTTNGVYQVSIPKPLNAPPSITASSTIDWSAEPYYIYEGSDIDFRSSNAVIASSENVEWIKLAFDADKQNLKILLEVTDDTHLEDVGFRFVILPDHLRGNWNEIAYIGSIYPPGSIVVDVHTINGNNANVVKLKVDSNQDATWVDDPLDWAYRDGRNLIINLAIMKNEPGFFDISTQDFIMERNTIAVSYLNAGYLMVKMPLQVCG